MNLSELIYKRLSEYEALTSHLAKFSELPAVFSVESPEDNAAGWDGLQYPKVVFNYDLIANEKRQSQGTLNAVLLCKNTSDVSPESIEREIVKALSNILLTPESGIPYCFAWASTEGFTIDEKNAGLTIGSEVRFDILEFPSQITTDPDPIDGVNRYLKDIYPESICLGVDRLGEITEITTEQPVLYARLIQTENTHTDYTVAWMDARIAVHVICPDPEVRLKMSGGINVCMVTDSKVKLLDGSPMHIDRCVLNNTTDYLKSGQISFTGKYGVLRYMPAERPLKNIRKYIEEGGTNEF